MESGGPYRRISRPGRLSSGSGGRGSGGGAGAWLRRERGSVTVLLALVLLCLLALQLKGGGVLVGSDHSTRATAALSSRAQGGTGALDASLLASSSGSLAEQPQEEDEQTKAVPAPAPTPLKQEQQEQVAPPPPPPSEQQRRWPRGVPRSIKAARWEAASSSAPTGGRGPGAHAAAAPGAVPPAACTGRSPSLPSVRPAFCEPLFCLRVAADAHEEEEGEHNDRSAPVFVDLAFSAFTRLEFSSEAEADAACGLPLRGQAGPEPPPGRRMASGTEAWWRQVRREREEEQAGAAGGGETAAAVEAAAAAATSSSTTTTPLVGGGAGAGGGDHHWTPPRPEVSFLLTVHNNPAMVVETVLELFRTSREARSVEFVVVDDGSTEDMSELALVGGVIERYFRVPFRMLRNAQSAGFGEANTQAARAARGEFLALVNSDALVTQGWLAALLAAHRDDDSADDDDDDGGGGGVGGNESGGNGNGVGSFSPTTPSSSSSSSPAATTTSPSTIRPRSRGVGMAGPLFLNSTGHVMEAGGVVWSDATAANFGRRDFPRHEHLYARRVDYMSAACVLVRRDTFVDDVGGFDPRYGKGYWEDTDLAMAYASRGYEARFVPAAIVLHDEGGSLSQQKRALMESNRALFFNKWRERLQNKHCPRSVSLSAAADRGSGRGRLLWVDDIVPEPDRDSGSIRTLNALRLLIGKGGGFRVSYQPTAGGRDARYLVAARNLGVDVLPLLPPDQWRLSADGGAAAAAARAAAGGGGGANQQPPPPSSSSSSACLYDVIVVARFYVYERAAAALRAACPNTPIVFDTVDVHFLREARMAISAEAAAAGRLAARREASAAAARELGGGGRGASGGDNSASVIVAPGALVPRAPVAAEAGLAAPSSSSSSPSASASWNFDHTDALAVVSWLDGKSPAAAAARRTRDREIALVRASTVTVVVSEVELPVLRHYAPGARLAVVSNVHDVDAIEGDDGDWADGGNEEEEEASDDERRRERRRQQRQRGALEGALAAAAARGEGKEAAIAEAVAAAIGAAAAAGVTPSDPTPAAATKTPSEEWLAAATAALAEAEAEDKGATATTPAIAPLLPAHPHKNHHHHREGRACADRSGVLFVGNFNHLPNQQAVRTLLDDVLPAVADVLPTAEARASLVLHIVGSNRAPDAALAGAKVTTIFHGWLSDAHLRLLYGSVKVVVAPLLSGAGVKGKINQAMLFGVPVVATPVAAEGMHLSDGANALVASSPREFAERTLRAYTDCALWESLVDGGRDNIRDYYSMAAAEKGLLGVMAQAGVPAPGRPGPAEQTCEGLVGGRVGAAAFKTPSAVVAALPAAAATPGGAGAAAEAAKAAAPSLRAAAATAGKAAAAMASSSSSSGGVGQAATEPAVQQ